MKRFFSALLAMMLFCALAAPALADVAYLPNDNFYERHRQDCRYENRNYYTNGEKGYVLTCSSPVAAAADALPNGDCYWISYVYTDGDGAEWGLTEFDPNGSSDWKNYSSYWVRMAEMAPDYDYRAFDAEHADEFIERDAELTWGGQDTVYTYKYPGSGIVTDEFDGAWMRDPLTFNRVFVDPAGREWGFVNYYFGHRNFWVCLDDPHNAGLEPDENYRVVKTVPAADPQVVSDAAAAAKRPTAYLYAGAAGVAAVAAAVLTAVVRRKKQAA